MDCFLDPGLQQQQATPHSTGGGTPSPCGTPFGTSDVIICQDVSAAFSVDPSDLMNYDSTSRLEDKLGGIQGSPYNNFVKVKISNISSDNALKNIIPAEDVHVRICCPGRSQFMLSDFRQPEGFDPVSSAYFIKPTFYDQAGGTDDTDPIGIPQNMFQVLVYGLSDAQLVTMRSYGTHYCIIAEILTQDRDGTTGALITADVDPDGAPDITLSPQNAVAWGYRRLAQRNIDRLTF
jgi:hypothetical protein